MAEERAGNIDDEQHIQLTAQHLDDMRKDWAVLDDAGGRQCLPARMMALRSVMTIASRELHGGMLKDAQARLGGLRKDLDMMRCHLRHLHLQGYCGDALSQQIQLGQRWPTLVESLYCSGQPQQGHILSEVLFDGARSDIKPIYLNLLNRISALMLSHPRVTAKIAGHADARGTADMNHTLSMKRAREVESYLRQQGVSTRRLTISANGEDSLREKGDSASSHQLNRRVELVLNGIPDSILGVRYE
jgi:outer membrane protein OmpA-like peptidoglycan-associated protein